MGDKPPEAFCIDMLFSFAYWVLARLKSSITVFKEAHFQFVSLCKGKKSHITTCLHANASLSWLRLQLDFRIRVEEDVRACFCTDATIEEVSTWYFFSFLNVIDFLSGDLIWETQNGLWIEVQSWFWKVSDSISSCIVRGVSPGTSVRETGQTVPKDGLSFLWKWRTKLLFRFRDAGKNCFLKVNQIYRHVTRKITGNHF